MYYKELIVWQKSVDFVENIYRITRGFPKDEKYNLVQQIRRASVSISSNIAEGNLRGSRNDYKRFLYISYSSAGEVDTQLIIAKRLKYLNESDYVLLNDQLSQIMKIINKIISKL